MMEVVKNNNKIIITDTSVLINFLNINRIDLLENYSTNFFITTHVIDEVTQFYPRQQERLNLAIKNNLISIVDVNQLDELALFSQLSESGRFGAGECSAIACAICRHYSLAIDDVRARKQAEKLSPNLKIITTQDIVVQLIQQETLTVDEADKIKNEWRSEYKFLLKVESFGELVGNEI